MAIALCVHVARAYKYLCSPVKQHMVNKIHQLIVSGWRMRACYNLPAAAVDLDSDFGQVSYINLVQFVRQQMASCSNLLFLSALSLNSAINPHSAVCNAASLPHPIPPTRLTRYSG